MDAHEVKISTTVIDQYRAAGQKKIAAGCGAAAIFFQPSGRAVQGLA